MERDSLMYTLWNVAADFNSHAHVERDLIYKILGSYAKNFNSHAHVERDIVVSDYIDYEDISTHTLTWSVTLRYS